VKEFRFRASRFGPGTSGSRIEAMVNETVSDDERRRRRWRIVPRRGVVRGGSSCCSLLSVRFDQGARRARSSRRRSLPSVPAARLRQVGQLALEREAGAARSRRQSAAVRKPHRAAAWKLLEQLERVRSRFDRARREPAATHSTRTERAAPPQRLRATRRARAPPPRRSCSTFQRRPRGRRSQAATPCGASGPARRLSAAHSTGASGEVRAPKRRRAPARRRRGTAR
jgi:hypothetical protein